MKQNGFLNLQYLNRSIKYTAFNVIVQFNTQNRTFKTLGNVYPTKLKAWSWECLSGEPGGLAVGAGEALALVTHTCCVPSQSERSPIFLSALLPAPFWRVPRLGDWPRPLHRLPGRMHRPRVFPTYRLVGPPAFVAFPNILLAKGLFLAKRNFSHNINSTP